MQHGESSYERQAPQLHPPAVDSPHAPSRPQAQARPSVPQLHHPRAQARVMISLHTTTSKLSDWSIFLQINQFLRLPWILEPIQM
ncbi:hypothetical protein GQ55_9G288000 [Panicum hallii var. hallii]|uniref:Uncharacterized protein n=1 Tax=Panicum hallii var. hallii TaxID=1504633 RepID=A0A2T7C7K6_9POAL|nr:hypothetical protein GQ55_9G288000 [Panicum hallii var. hallii]